MKYNIEITLKTEMLGTNPANTQILDVHIIEKERKMIQEKSKINSLVNKYLDELDISPEKKVENLSKHLDKMEQLVGYVFSEEERAMALRGEYEKLRETFAELDMKGTTVFLLDKETNLPCIGSYMINGFLKAASEAICRAAKEKSKGKVLESASYTQSIINQHVRVSQHFIPFDRDIMRDEDGKPAYLQRSLRAQTAQGPRISLARSEVMPAGSKLKFTMSILDGSPFELSHLKRLLDYGGEFCGLGQWRNGGYGLFEYKITETLSSGV